MKKFIFLSLTALLSVSLFLTGCGDAEGGAAGSTGSAGKAIATVPTGSYTAAEFQLVIDSADEVIVTGTATISDAPPIIVPADKKLLLAGELKLLATGALVIPGTASVSGKGKITGAGASAYLVAPPEVTAEYGTASNLVPVPFQAFDEKFDASGTVLGVQGPLAITKAEDATKLGTKKVFVTGDVTAKVVLGAATIVTLGNVTIETTAQTAAVVWGVGGNLDAKETPSDGTGKITVGGNAVFAKAYASTGGITIGGNATFKEAVTFATAGLTVDGTTTFDKTVSSTSVALTFGGPVEFKDDVTRVTGGKYTFGGNVTIAESKKITLGGTDDVDLKKGASIKAGSNVVLTAGGATIAPATAGAVLTATSKKIAVSTQGINVDGTLAVSGELEAGADITFKLATGILVINDGGKVSTTASGGIVLGDATDDGVTLTGAGSWTAGGSGVRLTNTAAGATSIGKNGSAAATLTANGTPTITVLKGNTGNPNELTLGADTTVALGGDGTTAVGTLTLASDGSKPGQLKFAHASTSIVSTGNTAGATKFAATKISGVAFGTVTADIYTDKNAAAGKFAKALGGTAANVLKGASSSAIVINSLAEATNS